MRTLQFPCILVEQPHQLPGSAGVLYDETPLLNAYRNAENNSYTVHANLAAFMAEWGDEPLDGVQIAAGILPDEPVVEIHDGGGHYIEPARTAQSELECAIEWAGHDLHAMQILESREEAEAALGRGGHHFPYWPVRDCMVKLGWAEEDDDGEDDYERDDEEG